MSKIVWAYCLVSKCNIIDNTPITRQSNGDIYNAIACNYTIINIAIKATEVHNVTNDNKQTMSTINNVGTFHSHTHTQHTHSD